jgi:hypothetical protein
MWFPARGKLAVNGGFGNVGVPPARVSGGLVSRLVSPESGAALVDGALRGGPQRRYGRSRGENFP